MKSNITTAAVRSPPSNLRLNQNARGDSKIIEELNLQVFTNLYNYKTKVLMNFINNDAHYLILITKNV